MHGEDMLADLVAQTLKQKLGLVLVYGAAVHQQARWLVDHHQHLILEQDVEWLGEWEWSTSSMLRHAVNLVVRNRANAAPPLASGSGQAVALLVAASAGHRRKALVRAWARSCT